MVKKGRDLILTALLVLLAIRALGNLMLAALSLNAWYVVVCLLYAAAFWGTFKAAKWGYYVAAGMTSLDLLMVAMIGGELTAASNIGAVAVDIVILVLTVMGYQKLKK